MRAVDEYTVHPWGLYLARPTPGRAQFHYLESWLLPSLGLRATVFHFNPSHKRDHDYYLDVGELGPAAGADFDVEVVVFGTPYGRARCVFADVDELLDAVRHGLLTPTVAEQAVRHAVDAVEGLARNGYDLTRWLATKGMELTWRSGS